MNDELPNIMPKDSMVVLWGVLFVLSSLIGRQLHAKYFYLFVSQLRVVRGITGHFLDYLVFNQIKNRIIDILHVHQNIVYTDFTF